MSAATSDVKKKTTKPARRPRPSRTPSSKGHDKDPPVCVPARLVSGRRKAQSAGESSDVVAWRSELKGEGAENAGKERVRVGQLDDEGS